MLDRVTLIVFAPSHLGTIEDTPSSDNPSNIPALEPPPSRNLKGSERVEDKKEGFLTSVVCHRLRKRGLLRIECPPGVVEGNSVADCSGWRKLATNFVATLMPSGEEVISIPDDDVHQSEGMEATSKQPNVDKDPSGTMLE